MAKIRKPKTLNELLESIAANELLPLLRKYGPTTPKGDYLHWDQFKWRVQNDSEDAAWLATKIARDNISKSLPLSADPENYKFQFCLPESLSAQLHRIDKMTGGGHDLSDGIFFSRGDKERYLVKTLMMEEAITSSQLEGAATTKKVAKEMLKSSRAPLDKSEQMIVNNYSLMKKALEYKNEPLSIDFILELHQVATSNAIDNDATPGELRSNNNIFISNIYNEIAHEPPCYLSLKNRLTALCEFANHSHDNGDFIHPLVKAIILHFMIGYIHPFGDGNGRTARALFYWYMLKSGYWLFEYVSISRLIQEKRGDYDKAFIYTEIDGFDLTYFVYHQVNVVTKAIEKLQQHIKKKQDEFYQFSQWIEHSPVSKTLKREHLEIIKIAMKHPGSTFTVKQVSVDLDVNENTARSYLNKLVEKQLLIASKTPKGKTVLYVAPAGLAERLKIT